MPAKNCPPVKKNTKSAPKRPTKKKGFIGPRNRPQIQNPPGTKNKRRVPNPSSKKMSAGPPGGPITGGFNGFEQRHIPMPVREDPYQVTNLKTNFEFHADPARGVIVLVGNVVIGPPETSLITDTVCVAYYADTGQSLIDTSDVHVQARSKFFADGFHPENNSTLNDSKKVIAIMNGGDSQDTQYKQNLLEAFNHGRALGIPHRFNSYFPGIKDAEGRSEINGKEQRTPGLPRPDQMYARLHNLSARLQCLGVNSSTGHPFGTVYYGRGRSMEAGLVNDAISMGNGIRDDKFEFGPNAYGAWIGKDLNSLGRYKSIDAAKLKTSPVEMDSGVSNMAEFSRWRKMCEVPLDVPLGSLELNAGLTPLIFYIPKLSSSVAGSIMDEANTGIVIMSPQQTIEWNTRRAYLAQTGAVTDARRLSPMTGAPARTHSLPNYQTSPNNVGKNNLNQILRNADKDGVIPVRDNESACFSFSSGRHDSHLHQVANTLVGVAPAIVSRNLDLQNKLAVAGAFLSVNVGKTDPTRMVRLQPMAKRYNGFGLVTNGPAVAARALQVVQQDAMISRMMADQRSMYTSLPPLDEAHLTAMHLNDGRHYPNDITEDNISSVAAYLTGERTSTSLLGFGLPGTAERLSSIGTGVLDLTLSDPILGMNKSDYEDLLTEDTYTIYSTFAPITDAATGIVQDSVLKEKLAQFVDGKAVFVKGKDLSQYSDAPPEDKVVTNEEITNLIKGEPNYRVSIPKTDAPDEEVILIEVGLGVDTTGADILYTDADVPPPPPAGSDAALNAPPPPTVGDQRKMITGGKNHVVPPTDAELLAAAEDDDGVAPTDDGHHHQTSQSTPAALFADNVPEYPGLFPMTGVFARADNPKGLIYGRLSHHTPAIKMHTYYEQTTGGAFTDLWTRGSTGTTMSINGYRMNGVNSAGQAYYQQYPGMNPDVTETSWIVGATNGERDYNTPFFEGPGHYSSGDPTAHGLVHDVGNSQFYNAEFTTGTQFPGGVGTVYGAETGSDSNGDNASGFTNSAGVFFPGGHAATVPMDQPHDDHTGTHGLAAGWPPPTMVPTAYQLFHLESIGFVTPLSNPRLLSVYNARNEAYNAKILAALSDGPRRLTTDAPVADTEPTSAARYIAPAVSEPGTVVSYRLSIGEQWCTRSPHDVVRARSERDYTATDPSVFVRHGAGTRTAKTGPPRGKGPKSNFNTRGVNRGK